MLSRIHTLVKQAFDVPDFHEADDKPQNLQLAAAVLLVEIAAADFEQQPEEQLAICAALKAVFELSDEHVTELFSKGQQASEQTVAIYDFTRVLNDNCTHQEKIYLVEQLWRVAFADGRIDKYEDHRIRKIAELLYLSHREFMQAKHSADSASA